MPSSEPTDQPVSVAEGWRRQPRRFKFATVLTMVIYLGLGVTGIVLLATGDSWELGIALILLSHVVALAHHLAWRRGWLGEPGGETSAEYGNDAPG